VLFTDHSHISVYINIYCLLIILVNKITLSSIKQ